MNRASCFARLVALSILGIGVIVASGCSSGGGSSAPPPEGADAAETSAAMGQLSVAGLEGIVGFDTDVGTATDGSEWLKSRLLSRLGAGNLVNERLTVGGAEKAVATIDCGTSGSLQVSCDVIGDQSILNVAALNCVEDDSGTEVTVTGSYQVIVDDPLVCDAGLVDGTDFTATFNNFTITSRVSSVQVARVFVNGTMSASGSLEPGCTTGGSLSGTFTMDFISVDDDVDASITAENLSIVVANLPSSCDTTISVDGVLDVNDRSTGERTRQSYNNFVVTVQQGTGSTFVSISGEASMGCLGAVSFTTVTPLEIPDGTDCPIGGELIVTIVNTGETARVTYNSDLRVDIDVDDDGSIDRSVTSCDELHAACTG